MKKTVVIHQPDFLPYPGFFHRFIHADLWIVLDHVQFVNSGNSWHYRDKIKTPRGAQWLSISVKKSEMNTAINRVQLSDSINWREKNMNLIRQNYSRAPYFNEILPFLQKLYSAPVASMMEFNLLSIDMLSDLFGIKIEKVFSSTLEPKGNKNELVIDLLKKTKADVYLSGLGAKSYMKDETFKSADIELRYQEYKHPVYPQINGEFIPNLSSIDLLFNCGITESGKILRNC